MREWKPTKEPHHKETVGPCPTTKTTRRSVTRPLAASRALPPPIAAISELERHVAQCHLAGSSTSPRRKTSTGTVGRRPASSRASARASAGLEHPDTRATTLSSESLHAAYLRRGHLPRWGTIGASPFR